MPRSFALNTSALDIRPRGNEVDAYTTVSLFAYNPVTVIITPLYEAYMTEQPSARYWNDINRYYGEIMAGLAPMRSTLLVTSLETYKYSWPSIQEGRTTTVEECIHRYFGGLLGKAVTCNLSMYGPYVQNERTGYIIEFNPYKEMITKTYPKIEPKYTYELKNFRKEFKQISRATEAREDARKLGMLLPTVDDFETLLYELQKGASQK